MLVMLGKHLLICPQVFQSFSSVFSLFISLSERLFSLWWGRIVGDQTQPCLVYARKLLLLSYTPPGISVFVYYLYVYYGFYISIIKFFISQCKLFTSFPTGSLNKLIIIRICF